MSDNNDHITSPQTSAARGDHPASADPDQRPATCDFCAGAPSTYIFPADTVTVPDHPEYRSNGNWAACDACANLLRNDNWAWLTTRTIAHFHAVTGRHMPTSGQRMLAAIYRALSLRATGALRPVDDAPSGPDSTSGTGHV